MPFTQGPRICLGFNLAWAGFYLALAGVFRRFESAAVREKNDAGVVQLFETDKTDVELERTIFLALARRVRRV